MEELHLPLKAFEAEMEQHSERMAEAFRSCACIRKMNTVFDR